MDAMKKHNESGFVAIIITALIMVILALITLGFARFMQREQRQALDRQLSRQALYAAETGINDTLNYIADGNTASGTCEENANVISGGNNGVIDSSNPDLAYTCILFNTTPGTLVYQLGANKSKLVQLQSTSGPIENIEYTWSSTAGDTTTQDCSSAGEFPSSRGGVPLLKIDLTNTSTLSRDFFLNNSAYIYASPCNGVGGGVTSFDYGASTSAVRRGAVVAVPCNSGTCRLTLTGLTGSNSSSFFSRVKPVYGDADVSIRATTSGGNSVSFSGSQTEIDVTAKANDVVRRLRVNVAVAQGSADQVPEAVFQVSDGFCKLAAYQAENEPYYFGDDCVGP